MKIAIIGGGAAGMTAAYLLDKVHDVTLFEKAPILGGNIKTLNRNIHCDVLDNSITLDNGVVEFQRDNFPNFYKLMHDLQVQLEEVAISSELFLADGHYYKSAGAIRYGCKTKREQIITSLKQMPIMFSYLCFLARISSADQKSFRDRPVSDFLGNSINARWQKMLLMYAYSMPYNMIDSFPAEIAIPLLRQSGMSITWDRIVGGVYIYIEKILSRLQGSIHCNANIMGISRTATGVQIKFTNGEQQYYDKVIFATTPDQILALLQDPSENETKRFQAWQANVIDTCIHTDTSMYKHFGVSYFCEFDLFQNQKNGGGSYNAYLDRLCGVTPEADTHYSLAYNLEQQIDPKKIIDVQQHTTPSYNVEAIHYRQEVLQTNGENNTYHAGAYLFDGLHEGAIRSAFTVSNLLGGLRL
ncbi:MAG: FAD-dependent oxidoreductase [Methyloprofundus sp.]|nr:FAD-dependent oxidoreductase [Methyloprofundus sp.]